MTSVKKYFIYKNYVNYFLKRLEAAKLKKEFRITEPQFFMAGLPRTGTTLMYQYVVHRLHMAYFTNKVGGNKDFPCAVTWLSKLVFPRYKSDFKSHYGRVEGNMAPREAGAFWLRFFHIDDYAGFQSMDNSDVDLLRRIIFCIQDIFGGAPYVNKNVKHILRLDALEKVFPDSVFIITRRDFEDVALSLLEGRKKNFGDVNQWLSVKPPSYETLKSMPYLDQIAHQVRDMDIKLREDLERIPANRVIYMDYEEFCRNPETLIEKIKEKCPSVKYKNNKVDSFNYKKRVPKNPEEEELVKKCPGL